MRSERCRTWAISSSSSTTRTRTGRAAVSIPTDGRPDRRRSRRMFSAGLDPAADLAFEHGRARRRRGVEGSALPMPARKAPARRGKPRARRAAPRPAAWPRLPELEQRQLDLIGLGLVALAVFFAFLVYLRLDGGEAGGWTRRLAALAARRRALRRAGRAAGRRRDPRAAAGAARPCGRSARARSACSPRSASAWRPGTLGLGPDGERPGFWDPEWVRTRGGMAGEALFWVTSTLLGSVGAHIVAVFLFLAGVLLLTGASVAGVRQGDRPTPPRAWCARAARRSRAAAPPPRSCASSRRASRA